MPWFKKGETATDPACLMKVKISNAKFQEVYKDKTYYFCSEGCTEQFLAEPEKYLK